MVEGKTSELHPVHDLTYAMELVHLDYLTIEFRKSDKDIKILEMMDHFPHYTQVFAIPSQTTTVTANIL